MSSQFTYHKRPQNVKSRYSLLVFDPLKQPFIPLTEFYHHETKRLSSSSALGYLNILLPFFDWMYQHGTYKGSPISWDSEPEAIKVATKEYLLYELYCKVRTYRGFEFVQLTHKSPSTVSSFLASLKAFYNAMCRLGQYSHSNPLLDSNALVSRDIEEGERKGLPRMPPIAGTEKPISQSFRRQTDSFFKVIHEEWKPVIIDDPALPHQVYLAGEAAGWSLRDQIIARLLFETGARASEAIEVTVGDYRARFSIREMLTFNKGSHGRRVKFLQFSDDTYILLMRYMDGERQKHDLHSCCFNELPDESPLFLTSTGKAYTYHAWYANWKKAMNQSELGVNPHKTRHWYVTKVIRTIYETSKSEPEIAGRIKAFVKYMNWRSTTTLATYEHFFDEKENEQLIVQVHESMKRAGEVYKASVLSGVSSPLPPQSKPRNIPIDDIDILDFFKGLED